MFLNIKSYRILAGRFQIKEEEDLQKIYYIYGEEE
jgi:hypothetical protein